MPAKPAKLLILPHFPSSSWFRSFPLSCSFSCFVIPSFLCVRPYQKRWSAFLGSPSFSFALSFRPVSLSFPNNFLISLSDVDIRPRCGHLQQPGWPCIRIYNFVSTRGELEGLSPQKQEFRRNRRHHEVRTRCHLGLDGHCGTYPEVQRDAHVGSGKEAKRSRGGCWSDGYRYPAIVSVLGSGMPGGDGPGLTEGI